MVVIRKRAIASFVSISLIVFFASSSPLAASGRTQNKAIGLPNEAVSKKILENGLVVLTKASSPRDLVAIDVRIKAGSSFEGEYAASGISHLVEHMVFKGTATRGVGAIEREIKSYGGIINGSVSQDFTDYHITVPSGYLKESIALLKDMLLNARFDNAEFEKEKEVIKKEIKMNEDEPSSQLIRLLNDAAYLRHPYKYPPIGYEKMFEKLSRDDAVKYYKRAYLPNRIVIAVVGDVDESMALEEIESEFKDFKQPNYDASSEIMPAEPAQITERRATKEMAVNLYYLGLGFHSTSVLDEDLFAMDVLAMILGRGNNSRLNTSLFKNKKLVQSVTAWNYTPRDPGLFVITAVSDKDNLDKVEEAVMDEIDKVRWGTVSDEEVETAKRMVVSDYIFSLETVESQASDITSNYLLTGNWDFSRRYVDGIQMVTKYDLQRAADKYLRSGNLTSVMLVPTVSKEVQKKDEPQPSKDEVIKEATLINGVKVIVREAHNVPTLSITVAMSGGLAAENEKNNGISNMTARMLLKGTKSRKEDTIEGAIEKLGGSISSFSGFNSFGLNIALLKTDIDEGLDILKDILTNSVFPQDQLERGKTFTIASIKEEDDDIFKRGISLLRKEIFANSPYGLRQLGEEKSVRELERYDLVDFYRTYCVPNNMVISISGDVDSGSLCDKLKKLFLSLKEKKLTEPTREDTKPDKACTKSLEMDKEESLILAGFETIGIKDPDRYPLEVLVSVLSGSSGRLFNELRGKIPFAYTLGCGNKLMLDTGFFVFYVATIKDKIPAARKALFDQIEIIRKSLIDDEELSLAKRELKTKYEDGIQANSFVSSSMALDELYGLGYLNIFNFEKEIEKVTSQDVKRVAEKYFDPDTRAEVIISPK